MEQMYKQKKILIDFSIGFLYLGSFLQKLPRKMNNHLYSFMALGNTNYGFENVNWYTDFSKLFKSISFGTKKLRGKNLFEEWERT